MAKKRQKIDSSLIIFLVVTIVAIVVLIMNSDDSFFIAEKSLSVSVYGSMQIKPLLGNTLWDRFMYSVIGSFEKQRIELINKNILYGLYSGCDGLTGEMLSDCIWAVDNPATSDFTLCSQLGKICCDFPGGGNYACVLSENCGSFGGTNLGGSSTSCGTHLTYPMCDCHGSDSICLQWGSAGTCEIGGWAGAAPNENPVSGELPHCVIIGLGYSATRGLCSNNGDDGGDDGGLSGSCSACETVVLNGKEVTRCNLPTAEEIASRGGGPGRANGPEQLCGCFCDTSSVWDNNGNWYPGLGCLHGVYTPDGMTGAWANNWWTSNYKYVFGGTNYYCDFFCGDGEAKPGSKTTKEECDKGLSLNPSEGITAGATDLRGYDCTDFSNYDGGSLDCSSNCQFDTSGCTTPTEQGGCTDTDACNYESWADYNDGSCVYQEYVAGCPNFIDGNLVCCVVNSQPCSSYDATDDSSGPYYDSSTNACCAPISTCSTWWPPNGDSGCQMVTC